MIKDFVKAWDLNKEALREYFKTHKQEEYDSYKKLVKLLFDIVINPTRSGAYPDYLYVTDDIHVIDDGDYQGTQIFMLYQDDYQPSVGQYVYTYVYYGSCSGCDTLQGIHDYHVTECPNEEQIEGYMTLCLHLLQRCAPLVDGED